MNFSDFDISGKVILITGCNGLLGRSLVEECLKNNAKVAGLDLEASHNMAFDKNENFIYVKCNIKKELEINKALSKIKTKFKRFDVLVNNAATKTNNLKEFFRKFEDYNLDTWQEVMEVNLNSMFLMSKLVGKEFLKNKNGGSMIQISSIYGIVSPDFDIYKNSKYKGEIMSSPAVYSASKAGVIGLTKWLASYWGEKNIKVNCIVPGGIEDSSSQDSTFSKNYNKKVPLSRLAKAEDIIPTILFLSSDASSYITGQSLVIDGGYSIR